MRQRYSMGLVAACLVLLAACSADTSVTGPTAAPRPALQPPVVAPAINGAADTQGGVLNDKITHSNSERRSRYAMAAS